MRYTSVLLFLFTACSQIPSSELEKDIRSAMLQQQVAWNNGDIPGFMGSYSDTICFIGRKGRTCGRDAVTANYIESYPHAATMGQLDFSGLEVVPLGAAHAWVTGNWELQRATDTVGGGFSLLWSKEGMEWRIVRDHTY